MKALRLLLAASLVLFAVFVAVNWNALLATTTLSLLVANVEAPLGIVLLGVTVVLAGLFLAYIVWWQAGVLMETRRHTKELQSQRELADKAEASRFTELQALLRSECAALKSELQQNANGLAAQLGELEDRLERQTGAPPRV